MKTRKLKLLSFLLALTALIPLFAGCDSHERICSTTPGSYFFDIDSFDFFTDVKIENLGEKKYSHAVSQQTIKGSISPAKYVYTVYKQTFSADRIVEHNKYFFDNCILEIEININGYITNKMLSLNTLGEATFEFYEYISPTYTVNVSYKVVNASGIVFAEIYSGTPLSYEGLDYSGSYNGSRQEYTCSLSSIYYDKNYETLHFYEYILNDEGTKFRFRPNSIKKEYKNPSLFKSCYKISPMSTKTIIFDGNFFFEDFVYEYYSLTGVRVFVNLFEQLNVYFPNLKNIVIKNLSCESDNPVKNFSIDLPESGVNFYLDDDTDFFTTKLKQTNFVRGVYSYDEFQK